MKSPADILYRDASDSLKVWIELVNKGFGKGELSVFGNSFDTHIEQTGALADSILAKLPQKPSLVADIGAGYGGVAVNLALSGINVIAIEPVERDRSVISYFVNKFPKSKSKITIKNGVGEKLPLKENSVDLCVLSQVLEHVGSPEKTIKEVARVLKLGGYLHLSSPNYLFPAEQHYRLPYIPLMPKKIFSKWALFLFKTLNIRNLKDLSKRDFSTAATFIDSINYTTDGMIKKLCRNNSLEIIWSYRDDVDFFKQIERHLNQNRSFSGLVMLALSLPIKFVRSLFVEVGVLPMKLEYLIQKPLEKSKVK